MTLRKHVMQHCYIINSRDKAHDGNVKIWRIDSISGCHGFRLIIWHRPITVKEVKMVMGLYKVVVYKKVCPFVRPSIWRIDCISGCHGFRLVIWYRPITVKELKMAL